MAQGKEWKPTDKERQQVEALVGAGFTHESIAYVLGVSKKTLIKHCKDELESGAHKANAFVVGQLFKKIREGDTASIFFWLKCRMGWREKDKDEDKPAPQVKVLLDIKTQSEVDGTLLPALAETS